MIVADHRYQDMQELATDLRRFLSGEEIQARPAGWLRKSARWIRRHPLVSLSLASSLLIVLVLAIVGVLLLEKREQQRKALHSMFQPIGTAFGVNSTPQFKGACNWCMHIDPRNPDGFMIRALYHYQQDNWREAARDMEECITLCRARNKHALETDAHYLPGRIKLCQAGCESHTSPRRAQLLTEVQAELELSGDCDFLSELVFFSHESTPFQNTGAGLVGIDAELVINNKHYLTHLLPGVAALKSLYKGGERQRYESAIADLEKVIEVRPDHLIALFALGRLQYFYSRYFQNFAILEEARAHLNRAVTVAGEDAYFLIYTTLGNISFYYGDNDGALRWYDKALKSSQGLLDNLQNVYGGKAAIFAQQGRTEEAFAMYERALEIRYNDPHMNVGIAELYLITGDLDRAEKYCRRAISSQNRFTDGILETRPRLASAFLTLARICLRQGDCTGALDALLVITDEDVAICSPRDMTLACFLAISNPDELVAESRDWFLEVAYSTESHHSFQSHDFLSPICLSGRGAAQLMLQHHREVIRLLDAAIAARLHWPDGVAQTFWTETIRDRYLQAMAWHGLARAEPALEVEALMCYELAESAFQISERRIDKWDIIEMVRARTKAVLGVKE